MRAVVKNGRSREARALANAWTVTSKRMEEEGLGSLVFRFNRPDKC